METTGTKFQRGMDTAEIAKRIRQDVKAAQKSGALPASMRVSVKTSRYSGGSSIRITIQSTPFQVHASDFIAHEVRTKGHQHYSGERYTAQARAMLEKVESMAKEYRRDNSDTQSDYFDVNFYLNVGFCWEMCRDEREMMEDYFRALASAPARHLSLVAP